MLCGKPVCLQPRLFGGNLLVIYILYMVFEVPPFIVSFCWKVRVISCPFVDLATIKKVKKTFETYGIKLKIVRMYQNVV